MTSMTSMTRVVTPALVVAALALGGAVGGVLGGCENQPKRQTVTRSQPKSSREAPEPGRRLSGKTRAITKVVVYHGIAGQDDRVAYEVDEGPGLKYQATIEGTQATVNPSGDAELRLDQGWVYLQGDFSALKMRPGWWRVPIVVTSTIDIGADGTEFLVKKDGPECGALQTIACQKGAVSFRVGANAAQCANADPNARSGTGAGAADPIEVKEGCYMIVKWNVTTGTLDTVESGLISAKQEIADLLAKGAAHVGEVQSN